MGVRMGSLVARLVGAAVLAALLLVASTATAIWWTARQDSRPASDAIVVLGSAQYNGVPSSIFEARLEHALKLYADGVAPVIVTVGGKAAGDQFTEAEAGQQYLAESGGVPADALLAVEEGVDTLESMRAVGRAFAERGWDTAVLVTDPWHAMRAERMAEDAGIQAESSPTRQGPAVQTRTTQFRYIMRETAAYLLYRVTGESVAGAPGIG
ncbi:YdcF family protein [Blastococcus sp. SYSU D00813]